MKQLRGGQLGEPRDTPPPRFPRLDGNSDLAHKLRGFLFGLRQFSLNKEDQTISLKDSDAPLLKCVEREIVRRITKFAAPPIDVAKVAAILYGDDAPNRLEAAQRLVNSFTQKQG